MSLIPHRLLLYPDHPFGIGDIWAKRFDPQVGRLVPFLVTRAPELPQEIVYPKERKLIEDIQEELREGRRGQVYATFTGEHDVVNTVNEARFSITRLDNHIGTPVGGVGVTLADQGIQAGGQGIIQGFPKQAGVEEMFFNGFSVGTNPFSVAQVTTTYDLHDSVSRTIGNHTIKPG